ncbi:E3 ubiquitin-protein ligase bre1 [Pestalotiopsis sp. IQ-011]
MDSATCNVIYVDRNVRTTTLLTTDSSAPYLDATLGESLHLRGNVALLIDAFRENTPHDEQRRPAEPSSRDHSPYSRASSGADGDGASREFYGLKLLDKVVYELHSRNLSKLVVPISVVTYPLLQSPPPSDGSNDETGEASYAEYLTEETDPHSNSLASRDLLRKCLDSGAIDVLASPLHVKTLTTLEVHAYRAHKEAEKEQDALMEIRRGRKRSWVGVSEEQPFSYLREAMVSGLMGGICRSGDEGDVMIGSVRISVSSEARAAVTRAIGKWNFCAHDFDEDQLLIAASLMFKHALTMPELEQWRIPTDHLITFLVACRAAYNTFVPYHNFRHAVDVLQATFHFLLSVGALPPYPLEAGEDARPIPKTPIAELLRPFETLTLLVSAIGHDVGHPGVNNGFLVTLNAPLAQLYNDRSVLESFHCAAFSQILRRYWPKVFENTKMRNLMISSILATDMGLHFDYMAKLGTLQEKLSADNSTDTWNEKTTEVETALICALLIKCADISNVWMHILCDEFSRQASMENQIGIPSSLISEPKKDFLALAKAQLGFMNLFAIPLFQGVADVLPCMKYTVEALDGNRTTFEKAIEEFPALDEAKKKVLQNSTGSPRTVEIVLPLEDSPDSSSGTTLEASYQTIPENHADMKKAGSSPPGQPQQIPNVPGEYKEVNGLSGDFDEVAHFAASDPFNVADDEHGVVGRNAKQRCSETTEGSTTGPYSGDWASQATSATTGKMPLSPSTQGTSIRSQESLERPSSSLPATTVTAPDVNCAPMLNFAPEAHYQPHFLDIEAPQSEVVSSAEEHSNGSTLKLDSSPDRSPSADKSLKKKPSRFRMNALKLFRRDRGSTSPASSETAG